MTGVQTCALPIFGVILDGKYDGDDDDSTTIIDKSLSRSPTSSQQSLINRQKGQLVENLLQNRAELMTRNEMEQNVVASEISARQGAVQRTGIILQKKPSTIPSADKLVSPTVATPVSSFAPTDTESTAANANIDDEFMRLRQNIQIITRSTNPLGKNMEYVQEDLDTIHRENEKWRQLALQEELKLQEEKQNTEQQLKGLQSTLLELEQQVHDKVEKINTIKASVLRNDMVIERLLRTVTSS